MKKLKVGDIEIVEYFRTKEEAESRKTEIELEAKNFHCPLSNAICSLRCVCFAPVEIDQCDDCWIVSAGLCNCEILQPFKKVERTRKAVGKND